MGAGIAFIPLVLSILRSISWTWASAGDSLASSASIRFMSTRREEPCTWWRPRPGGSALEAVRDLARESKVSAAAPLLLLALLLLLLLLLPAAPKERGNTGWLLLLLLEEASL
jgi:hypothetical protein